MTISELTNILIRAGVEAKSAPNGEIAVNCTSCGDHKLHARISLRVGWVHCHRRGCNQTLSKYLKSVGINQKLSTEWVKEPGPLDRLEQMFQGKETPVQHNSINIKDVAEPFTSLTSVMRDRARLYLHSRGMGDEIIDTYQLMVGKGDLSGRIVIPFFENGKLVYYQARAFLVPAWKKVMNPDTDTVIEGKSNWLFNIDQASMYDEVVVTEGWASAISCGPNAVSIQGNRASATQLCKLCDHWNKFVVCLDADTYPETLQLCRAIKARKPRAKVRDIDLLSGDPNECYNRDIMKHIIKEATEYNELDAMGRCL